MTEDSNIEARLCEWYIEKAIEEMPFSTWRADNDRVPAVLVVEGFEERSIGFLRRLADTKASVPALVLGRYADNGNLNVEFRGEFEALARRVAPGRWQVVELRDGGEWARKAAQLVGGNELILDISALTSRGIFFALDQLTPRSRHVSIAYTEAREYRPTREEWERLLTEVAGDVDEDTFIAEKVDEMPWLYSGTHHAEIVTGHGGFDAAGVNALVAFLPFKCARLAAVLGEQDYSAYVFIKGRPRLETNSFRLEALKRINSSVVKDWPIVHMDTFGYKSTLSALSNEICGDDGLLQRFDVHLAPMGSKLQKVACWVLSMLVPSVTVITSIAHGYHPEAFSHGVGESWVFPLLDPNVAFQALRCLSAPN